jgi:hypothetical protein
MFIEVSGMVGPRGGNRDSVKTPAGEVPNKYITMNQINRINIYVGRPQRLSQRTEDKGRFAEKAKPGCMVFGCHAHPGLTLAILKSYRGFRVLGPGGGFEEMPTTPLGN